MVLMVNYQSNSYMGTFDHTKKYKRPVKNFTKKIDFFIKIVNNSFAFFNHYLSNLFFKFSRQAT